MNIRPSRARGSIPRWASILFLALGAYIICLSLGVVAGVPRPGMHRGILLNPEHWAVTCVGTMFFCAGIAIALQDRRRRLLKLNGALMLATLAASIFWVLFFSGKADLPMQVIGGIILAVGTIGGLAGLVLKPKDISTAKAGIDDPIAQAQLYQAYGRSAQAIAVLQRAALRDPHRAAEFHAKLTELQSRPVVKKSFPSQLPSWFAMPVFGGMLLQAFASPSAQWLDVLGKILFFGSIPCIFVWLVYQRVKPK